MLQLFADDKRVAELLDVVRTADYYNTDWYCTEGQDDCNIWQQGDENTEGSDKSGSNTLDNNVGNSKFLGSNNVYGRWQKSSCRH